MGEPIASARVAPGQPIPVPAPGQPLPAAPVPVAAAPSESRPRFQIRITLEAALYLVLIALAALTRFWDLGYRTLHHDESLHSYFSWLYATGNQYVHDPLMHGPFLFHANALVYFLLGATDVTSRIMPALCSTVVVGLPWFLRGPRHLGRPGALIAAVLLLFSPSMLYQGQYLRHDSFTVVGTMVLLIALVRYIERPSRGWAITMSASLAFLLTNHEIVFGIAALFLAAVVLALLWGPLRSIAAIVVGAGVIALVLVAKVPKWTNQPLPEIPWQSPTQQEQLTFYRDLLLNPLPLSLLALAVITLVAIALVLRRKRDPERVQEGWVASLLGNAEPGSVAYAVNAFWADRAGVGICVAVFGIIFAVFFTSLFTNVYGLATGTIATDGTLFYWLGQHDYRRGEQPWFYYMLLTPQYEPLAVFFSIAAVITFSLRGLLTALGRRPASPRLFFQMLLVIWGVGIFLALTWAGEKMPWLILHITLPAILLSAALIGEFGERWRASVLARPERNRWRAPETVLTAGLLLCAAAWFLIAARLTYGQFVAVSEADNPGGWLRELTPGDVAWWWALAAPALVALVLLVVWVARRGIRRAGAAALVAVIAGLLLLQVHIGWRLTYLEPDVPKDMLVYTQTSPDISRMMADLTEFSSEMTGGKDLEIWFDDNNGVAWPMQWYLRDFPNRHLYSGSLDAAPTAPIVLAGDANTGRIAPYMTGYTATDYVLRWWFPEDAIYRKFAIAPELSPGRSAWGSPNNPHGPLDIVESVLSSLATMTDPAAQQKLYRLVMYRDLPLPFGIKSGYYTGYTGYTLYVRNDLLPLFNQIRYESPGQ